MKPKHLPQHRIAADEQGIGHLWGESVRRNPDRIAIQTPEARISYAQLGERVAGWILAIERAGLSTGSRIAIGGATIEATLAAQLACLCRGQIYTVLDPAMPPQRLEAIRADFSPQAICGEALPALSLRVPYIQSAPAAEAEGVETHMNRETPVEASTVAYVAYTSGTTGTPKGVVHTHGNIRFEVAMHTRALGLSAEDRLSGLYSPAVVGSVRDIFAAFLNGATYCPLTLNSDRIAQLPQWIQACGITRYHSVPAVFRAMLASDPSPVLFKGVRTVFLAGDQVRPSDLDLFRQYFPEAASFYTGIGASETASLYAHWHVPRDFRVESGRLPSGYPADEIQVELIDPETGEKAGSNKAGEIAVSSPALAEGYWQKEEATAECFRMGEDGRRWYLTGDRGRWDREGRLVHLGRLDRQLKVNGQRVELPEIEHALRQLPEVHEACVVSFVQRGGDTQLAAYLEMPERESISVMELRERLASSLTPAAIPQVFIVLDALPRNQLGKIQPGALPSPESGSNLPLKQSEKSTAVIPKAAETDAICDLFAALLNVPEVDPEADFRWLGGDSLKLVSLTVELERRYAYRLNLDAFPAGLTASSIARALETSQGVPAGSSIVGRMRAQIAGWSLPEGCEILPHLPLVVVRSSEPKGAPLLWLVQTEEDLQWALSLSRERDLYLMPSGYRLMEEGTYQETHALLDELATDLVAVLPGEGCYLGGYCGSGVIAVALASVLETRGINLHGLLLVDSFGTRRARALVRNVLLRVLYHGSALRRKKPGEVLRYLSRACQRFLRRQGGRQTVSEPKNSEPRVRLLYDAPAWGGPVCHVVTRTTWSWRLLIPRMGWSRQLFPGMRVRRVPGNHYTLFSGAYPNPAHAEAERFLK